MNKGERFLDRFDNIVSWESFDDVMKEVFAMPSNAAKVWYKWPTNTELWVGAPGLDKDSLDAKMEDGKIRLTWETKYHKGDYLAKPPKGTQNVEVEVDNGMIVVTFVTTDSDISVEVK